ncbi:MAG: hypothetical protein Q7R93_03580 [bacterium]|nr:hypothetical protein [bacterium]
MIDVNDSLNGIMIAGIIIGALGGIGGIALCAEGMTFPCCTEYDWASKRRDRRIKICMVTLAVGFITFLAGMLFP